MMKLSLELALKTLRNLGLTERDAQVYVYLAKKGPREENKLALALNMKKDQLCLSLEDLASRGMVSTISEQSVKYFAVPLEKVLDELIKAVNERAKVWQASKEELLSTWRSLEKDTSSKT
jgi:sugar-specific transcriptional regulator TrmB